VEGEFTNCPGCGQRIDPDDPTNLPAVEMVRAPSFGARTPAPKRSVRSSTPAASIRDSNWQQD
jgi:hypothetical protein